ncbi:MAG: RNA methyltransferase [Trueperaceae bacterium]|nr:RNA methyltransferase [Trueperaceae bacterium]MCC6311913.1 RNA methyltransferase [Trueperaceae bacterium]MCO5172611.1 RNA methyltransferase [Trueperaceae bacterium]MCW5819914.1 RNA methyltransferase [Trueperaceae bacterium]
MAPRHVESAANPLVKELAALKDRRARERSGTYLVEGRREAARALDARVDAAQVLVAPSLLPGGSSVEAWQARAEAVGAAFCTASASAFKRVSMRENPDGVLLVVRTRRTPPAQVRLPSGALVLVLAGLEKPGNVGALLRSADAFGADAVFMCPDQDGPGGAAGSATGADLENPNLIRAAMGSSFTLSVGVGTREEVLSAVRAAGLHLVATSPAATTTVWDCDLTAGVAILLGREHDGLSDWWLEHADEQVQVPMRSTAADSLNVSVTGALLLFEASRQRRGSAG